MVHFVTFYAVFVAQRPIYTRFPSSKIICFECNLFSDLDL